MPDKYTFCEKIECSCYINNICITTTCHHPGTKKIYDNPDSADASKLTQELAQKLIKENKEKLFVYSIKFSAHHHQKIIMDLAEEIDPDIKTLEQAIDILARYQALRIFCLVEDIPSQEKLDEIIERFN